jgi:hypothetical protein
MSDSGSSLLAPVAIMGKKAGEPVQIPTTGGEAAAKTILIQALGTNEGPIVVGDANVVAKEETHGTQPVLRGVELAPKALVSIDIIDGAGVFFDVRKEKDGISYVVLRA